MTGRIIYDGKTVKEWAAIWGLSVGHTRRWIRRLQAKEKADALVARAPDIKP